MSRKDSRGMFANVLGNSNDQIPASTAKTASPHLMKVAAGVRQIQERGDAFDRLLKNGDHIIDLDIEDIAPSSIQDRFDGAYGDNAVTEIASSMRERGQIVPGLVRPIAGGPRPYQIVFGRRRLAAAKLLGLKFRAIVKELSDDEAIVFQGEENTNRNDLSFIEKCAFALLQEQAGYRRDVICASLSTSKSHISEMLQIATVVPRDLLTMIGRSPDIGRRRWLQFAELFAAHPNAHATVENAISVIESDAPDRFGAAFTALKAENSKPLPIAFKSRDIHANGFLMATLAHTKVGSKLNFAKSISPEFVEFLSSRLPDLHEQFMSQKVQTKGS